MQERHQTLVLEITIPNEWKYYNLHEWPFYE